MENPTWKKWLCRLALVILVVGVAALRLAYLASEFALDLVPDEAHYWEWSRRLDWSYYSKGPLVAWLIHLSWLLTEPLALEHTGQAMLAVRLPAVMCGSLLLVSLYVLALQVFRSDGLALGIVLSALTLPLVNAGGVLMTIDAPYTCCWGWALVFGYQAVFRQANWAWYAAGVMVALGILAKYTMVLWMPSLALFFLFTPGFRHYLFSRGFLTLVLVGSLGLVPILIWNLENGWITFQHMRGHAGLYHESLQIWRGPLTYLVCQLGVLMGYWFLVWVCAMWHARPWREPRTDLRYLWWLSAPTFLVFLAFSPKNGGGEPNWPATAYLSGLVLGASWLSGQIFHARLWHRSVVRFFLAAFCALGVLVTGLLYFSPQVHALLQHALPDELAAEAVKLRRLDPSLRCQGWSILGQKVDELRRQLGKRGVETYLAATSWTLPGEVAFYCADHPVVYNLGPLLGERHSQFDLWRPNPALDAELFRGRTFLVIGDLGGRGTELFDRVEPPLTVQYEVAGQVFRTWTVQVAWGYKGSATLPPRRY